MIWLSKMGYNKSMLLKTRVFLLIAFAVMVPLSAHAATLYIDPETGTYGPGDTFIASVRLDNDGECINAVEAAIDRARVFR